jgi:hypothetical protein
MQVNLNLYPKGSCNRTVLLSISKYNIVHSRNSGKKAFDAAIIPSENEKHGFYENFR